MQIKRLKINHLVNPLGYELKEPTASFVIEGGQPDSVQVQVACDQNFSHLTAVCDAKDPRACRLTFEPKARTRYYWRVIADGCSSETAWFETGKLDEPWNARWISPVVTEEQAHPKLMKDVSVRCGLERARLYMTGLGLYELYIDEKKQGEEYLQPGFTKYDSRIQYQTYDVTEACSGCGSHRISILLGNGWYKGYYSQSWLTNIYGDRFSAIAELHLDYADGTHEVIVTDESWQAVSTPILSSSIYDGEAQDDTAVEAAYPLEVIDGWTDLLRARLSPPITVHEKLTPVEIIHTPAGETVLDMGQNMVGWLTFRNRAPKGEKIVFRTGEILQDGNFFRDNLLTAKSMFTYVSDGSDHWVRPHFTYYGFRYVRLENWPEEIRAEDFSGWVIHSDMEAIGRIETANPLINQLIRNVRWGQKGNFLDIPTDCPQRDERMGWTGDAQVFSGTACFNYDTQAFYTKYGLDLYDEQRELNGSVPYVVPMAGYPGDGSTAWGDAATIIPWNVYVHNGDASFLAKQYPGMKAWVDYLRTREAIYGSQGLLDCDFHFADWLALDGPGGGSNFGGTDPYLIASCYYRYSSLLVSKAAEAIGQREDADGYRQLSERVRQAVCDRYLTKDGRLAEDTMTGYVVMLYMDMAPETLRGKLADRLAYLIRRNNGHLKTGFVGTPYLCRVLSDFGYNDLAYTLLLNEDYPSWLYQVRMGATTVWERWNAVLPDGHLSDISMNSLNHYAYGSIVEWIYRYVGGIQPDETSPGFHRLTIAPQPDIRLPWAEVQLDSASGHIRSYWRIEDKRHLHVEVTIPAESEAHLVMPDADARKLSQSTGLFWQQRGSKAETTAEGGDYIFDYTLTRSYSRTCSVDMAVDEVFTHPEAKEVLTRYAPAFGLKWNPFSHASGCLRDLLQSALVGLSDEQLEALDQELMVIPR